MSAPHVSENRRRSPHRADRRRSPHRAAGRSTGQIAFSHRLVRRRLHHVWHVRGAFTVSSDIWTRQVWKLAVVWPHCATGRRYSYNANARTAPIPHELAIVERRSVLAPIHSYTNFGMAPPLGHIVPRRSGCRTIFSQPGRENGHEVCHELTRLLRTFTVTSKCRCDKFRRPPARPPGRRPHCVACRPIERMISSHD